MTPVRARLRAATAEAHASLDRALALEARLATRADLIAVLARFHGFFARIDPALARSLGAAMAERRRLPDLVADLRGLGLGPAELSRIPPAPAFAFGSRDAALGALYVVEGARIGGTGIARMLAARGLGGALRFWSDDPPRIAALWHGAIALVETAADIDEAVAGARSCFALLHAWLATGGVAATDGLASAEAGG